MQTRVLQANDGVEGVVIAQGAAALRSEATASALLCARCRRAQDAYDTMEANYLMRDIDALLERCARTRRDDAIADALRRTVCGDSLSERPFRGV